MNHPQIAAFARLATENTAFLRSIEGQKSLLSRTMHDLAYDPIHDEIVVTGPLTQSILTFRGAANGEEAPVRVIQGSKTEILGVGAVGKVSIDPKNNEILLATPEQKILVFSRDSNGNVAPVRTLGGPDTMLRLGEQRDGSGQSPPVRVDSVNDLLLVPSGGKMLIFDRTASGNTKPRAIIVGPVRTGNQFEIYGPKRRLITHSRDMLEIWNIPDHGESTEPPVVRIPCPLGRASNDTGMVLDPVHKEVIIATAAGNTVMTFSVPEVFN